MLKIHLRRLPRIQSFSKKKNVVLVDFDGVISRCPRATQIVHDRILNYVKHVTGVEQADVVRNINKQLYEKHGHTLLGLQSMGYQVTIEDFNAFVYNDIKSCNLSLTQAETFQIVSFMIQCNYNGIDVMLFSNASMNWLTNFMTWDCTLYNVQYNIVHTKKILKPSPDTYITADAYLKEKGYDNVFFIDDKLDNLIVTPPQWHCILFRDRQTTHAPAIENYQHIDHVTSLKEAVKVIETKI